jgi:site-specific DNA-cytosine methylase
MNNLLELFSGTQSVGEYAKTKNYNVISVDITDYNGKYKPTHKISILDFDYTQYPPNYFKCIWASPPCVNYSTLQYSWIGRQKRINGELVTFTREMLENNMLASDQLVLKTIEIINYFNPELWFIENPKTGNLRKRDFMQDLNYYDVDYCKYSDWGYKKATRIWTNKMNFENKKCCGDCENMVNGKHLKDVSIHFHKLQRYRIPPNLVKELLE